MRSDAGLRHRWSTRCWSKRSRAAKVRWQDAQWARSMPYQRCSQPAQVTGSQVGSSFATTGRLRVLTDETGVIARGGSRVGAGVWQASEGERRGRCRRRRALAPAPLTLANTFMPCTTATWSAAALVGVAACRARCQRGEENAGLHRPPGPHPPPPPWQLSEGSGMRIAVMGTGGVGGYFGARLAGGGQDVSFVARGRQLDALRRNGVRVQSPLGDVHLPEVGRYRRSGGSRPGRRGPVRGQAVGHGTGGRPAGKPVLGEGAAVVSFQNGVVKDDLAAPRGSARPTCWAAHAGSRRRSPNRG